MMLKKKYDFTATEAKLNKFWADNQVYKYDDKASGEVYSIDTPPPTVSGKIHIGHIFSYTQAEMIARYQRMLGKNVFYPFGFDDNGLPTERLVERDLKIIAKDMKRENFVDKCLKSTQTYEDEFKMLWQQMGFSCDWDLSYRTIDEKSQRISQRSFLELARSGKAFIEESPVLWCHHCQTSIAQAELESFDKKTNFITIKFEAEEDLFIATTRPEMLYACVAIIIHPDDERYKHLIGQHAKVPLYDFKVPIIADEAVLKDKGTGLVMCCTFGDITDLEWYKKYQFELKQIINEEGHMNDEIPFIGGLYLTKARKEIIHLLDSKRLIVQTDIIEHTVSVHERCGTPVEILPSKQWYIDIMSNREAYINATEKINWYPAHMKKRCLTWIENLKWNWCISRQRFYGVPLPVWYCDNCGKSKFPEDDQLPINPMTSSPTSKCSCGSNRFSPETAVLDTWATSSITPELNNNWGEEDECALRPMSLRTQAHEIIRTWAFYTIVKSHEHHKEIPWKDIMISGFVLAKKGEKISKSKNNATQTPAELIEVHSADAIRYWAANSRLGTDTMFDENELKVSKRFMTKLWNAAKFSMMMIGDFENFDPNKVGLYDKWIIDKYHHTVKQAKFYLDKYEVGLARQEIDDFFWKDFCDNYLEYVKDRLYKTDLYDDERIESGKQTLYYTMLGILKLYSIYTPYITEEIYQSYFKSHQDAMSIHLTEWDGGIIEESGLQLCDAIKEILFETRKFKSERNLSMKEPLNKIEIGSPLPEIVELCSPDLIACTHTKEIVLHMEKESSIIIQ